MLVKCMMLVKCIMFGKYIILEKNIIGASKIKKLTNCLFFQHCDIGFLFINIQLLLFQIAKVVALSLFDSLIQFCTSVHGFCILLLPIK